MAVDETVKKSTFREYYEALLIAVIFVNFARIFAFQAFKIPTGSMEDNLKVGDHIIVNKFIYGPGTSWPVASFREIQRRHHRLPPPAAPDTDFVSAPVCRATRWKSTAKWSRSTASRGGTVCDPRRSDDLSAAAPTSGAIPIARSTGRMYPMASIGGHNRIAPATRGTGGPFRAR
jgi:hypothetical protein